LLHSLAIIVKITLLKDHPLPDQYTHEGSGKGQHSINKQQEMKKSSTWRGQNDVWWFDVCAKCFPYIQVKVTFWSIFLPGVP